MSAGEAVATVGRGGIRLTARAAVLTVLVVVLVIASIVPVRQYLAQRTRIAELERRAARIEAANRDVAVRIEELKEPAVLERLARECLGMVEPGEIAFVPIPEDGGPAKPDC